MRRKRRTSWQMIAKSRSIKGVKRKSGGCAWKAKKLTSGGLPYVPDSETEEVARLPDRAAEVSRGRSSGVGTASGTLIRKERNGRCSPASVTTVKARTVPPQGGVNGAASRT